MTDGDLRCCPRSWISHVKCSLYFDRAGRRRDGGGRGQFAPAVTAAALLLLRATRWRVAAGERKDEATSLPARTLMAVRPQDTWYVSFEKKRISSEKLAFTGAPETFRSEQKAKEFAKQKRADTQN